jgi:dolichol kinase
MSLKQNEGNSLEMGGHFLKQRSDIHLARKIWHFLGVLLILVIYHNVSRSMALQLITFFTCLFVVFDIMRSYFPDVNNFLVSIFYAFMREHERNSLAGTTYLLSGTFLIMFLFPKPIVTLALMFLAVADPLAGYVGVLYGKDKIMGEKSLQGFVTAFICCSVIAGFFFFVHKIMIDRILIVSILSGLIGAFAELIPIFKLDDNFTFPVVSSVGLWLLFYLFGGF